MPLVAVGIGVVVAVAIGVLQRVRGPAPPTRNVVWVVIDTQRADVMSLYGHPRPTTPRIDAWAKGAVVFEDAWAQGTYTRSSYLSYMTSTSVRTHGLDSNLPVGGACDWTDLELASEWLHRAGYSTEALVVNPNLAPQRGFARGFDLWNGLTQEDLVSGPTVKELKLRDHDAIDRAIAIVEQWDGPGSFLYVHLLGPHLPVSPTAQGRQAVGSDGPGALRVEDVRTARGATDPDFVRETRLLYEAAVWDADWQVGRLLEAISARDDTWVMLFSDHGEELWEHGEYGHEDGVWQSLVHVPLVVDGPGVEGRREARPVELSDLLPTLSEVLGIPAARGWSGRSLFAPRADRVQVSQRFDEIALKRDVDGPHKAIWVWEDDPGRETERDTWASPSRRRKARKRARARGRPDDWRVYDPVSDPHEQAPLADPSAEAALREAYAEWLSGNPHTVRADVEPTGACTVGGKQERRAYREQLEALGYVE